MRTILSLLLLLGVGALSAQNYITLRGNIIDKDTKKPVAYAHVGILEKGIGTISGGKGSFVLKIPASASKSTLIVSFLGYKNYKRRVDKLKTPLVIEIKRAPMDLQEVIVMDEGAIEDILRRAIRRIPQNYPNYSTRSTGFYRESKTDSELNYLYVAEGVLEVYKTAYDRKKEGQTRLIQGRQVALVPPDELGSNANFSSGHLSGHRFDIVKNREDFIDEKYFPAYKYWVSGITTYNDKAVYVIGFEGEEEERDGRMKGKIYIDTLSYAFIRTEFEILPKGLKRRSDYPLYVGSWKANKYIVNYRYFGDRWYFSGALREGTWRDGGIYSNEYLTTEIFTQKAKPLPYQQRLDRSLRFRSLTGEYDKDFWKEFNTAPLGESLQETVQQMETQKIAAEVFDPKNMERIERERDSMEMLEIKEIMAESNTTRDKDIAKIQRTLKKRKLRTLQFRARIGLTAHRIPTQAANMTLSYLDKDSGDPIVSVTNSFKAREFEYTIPIDFDLVFAKNWFVRWGVSVEFLQSIYKEHSFGIGGQVNLTKKIRPIFLRGLVQHSKHQYAVRIGQATNDFGKFKAGKKKFKSDKVNMYYGSRTHNLKATLELAVEINPGLEIFASGSYMLPFARQRHIYLWERERLFMFRRRARIAADSDQVLIARDDAPFDGEITDFNNYIFSIGIIKK